MKTNRIVLTIVSILTIFAMVACGATGPKPIETPAKDINFAVADLCEGYSMLQETDDIASMGLSSSDPVNSASMRAFTTDKMDMVVSVVMNAKTANNSEVLLSSVDQDKPILKGIYDGIIVGTAAYSSIAPARWCMSQMVNLLNGVPIPGVLFYATKEITPDNVVEMFEYYYPGKTLQDYIEGKVE